MKNKKANRPGRERTFVADRMMCNVAQSLIRDFRNNLNDPFLFSDLEIGFRTLNVERIRTSEPTVDMHWNDIALFKASYQMQSIVKRYRFEQDLHSDQELIDKAINGFLETQDRLASLDLSSVPASTHIMLDLAARYVAKVLGPYDDEECRALCRFGKRASVGIPARKACEAERWEIPMTGSPEQISWFDSEMSQVACVQDYWAKLKGSDLQRSTYQETSSLKLSLVPKTFKSLRSIMPNTTVGSYMSFGLGEIIRKRLRRAGFDIRTLQQRHRVLAQTASVTNTMVTADLSSASDSISVALVDRLFPADWREILHKSRIGRVELPNGQTVESNTFCTMGIGYTFPLQTLVFLSLLKAIEKMSGINRFFRDERCSVYGDDMIYSRRIHEAVARNFSSIGFILNVDKTFIDGSFRESCGGDYYRGVDVRPFQPRNGSAKVGKRAYEAMLYKYLNGLLRRWDEHEIGGTIRYLLSELVAVTGKPKLVPSDYPDDAGIRCPTLRHWEFLKDVEAAQPVYVGHGVYRFSYLRLTPELREETRHEPYFWAALRGINRTADIFSGRFDYQESGSASETVRRITILTGADPRPSPLIEKEEKPITFVRSKITGQRLRRVKTFVTVSHTGRYMRQSGLSCFEDRR